MDIQALEATCRQVRRDIVTMCAGAGSGHPGGSLSCTEALVALYFDVMKVDPKNPKDPARDRFVLSKGHAAPALYGVLAERGFFSREEFARFRQIHSILQGHPDVKKCPGVDASTGSLGQGISAACGMALAAKYKKQPSRVYALLGDGELQEGQNWEAFMSMRAFALQNMTPIVDLNGVQLDGPTEVVQPAQAALSQKLAGFGIRVFEVEGHDEGQIERAVREARNCGEPHAVVAHTVKGKGVSFMEGQAAWHGKPLSAEDYAAARAEIEGRLMR